MKPKIILTFDLEEFDLPLEYNCPISEKLQFEVTSQGLLKLMTILKVHNIKSTFFVTGNYCDKNKLIVKQLSEIHEIGSHGYYHSNFDDEFLLRSKEILETVTGKRVRGFRMPLLKKIDHNLLNQAGYEFDSSINPTFLPGRYNNFRIPRTPYKIGNTEITEFPSSVSPAIRFPLFWLSFKNIPFPLYKYFCKKTIKKDRYLHLYFHPWEFADLSQFKIPGYIRNPNSNCYVHKFEKLLNFLKKQGDFVTVTDFLSTYRI